MREVNLRSVSKSTQIPLTLALTERAQTVSAGDRESDPLEFRFQAEGAVGLI